MTRLSTGLMAAVFCGFLLGVTFARADTRVRIDLTGVIVDISPTSTTHRTPIASEFTLSGRNEVRLGDTPSRLGKTHQQLTEPGQQYNLGTSVREGAVVFRKEYPKYYAVTTVRSDGKNSCEASINYYRKPGQRYFTYTDDAGGWHNAVEFYAENVRCTILN